MQVLEDLVYMDLEIEDTDSLFDLCVEKFVEKGYVKDTYLDAIKIREKEFPTGLPTIPYAVAIPHTDPIHVNKSGIAVVKPKNGIKFKEMGTIDGEVFAKFVFFLIIEDGNNHIEALQQLINFVMNEDNMNELVKATNPKEIADVINFNLNEGGNS